MSEKGCILVVDDNPMNRDMLSRRLQRKGYEVQTAEDGIAALETLHDQAFDIILLDLHMPRMSGLEVLERIRVDHSQLELPVLMVTANTDSAAVVDALSRGANDYVTKPIDFPVVLARVEGLIMLRRAYSKQMRAIRQPPTNPKTAETPNPHLFDGRYELLELVGEGGFAVVYKARQISTGQTVAVKLLRSQRLHATQVEHVRFEREMRAIGRIRHPNIVRLIDSGRINIDKNESAFAEADFMGPKLPDTVIVSPSDEVDPHTGDGTARGRKLPAGNPEDRTIPYIVMEYLSGETLADRLARESVLGISDTLDVMLPILSAVDAAHAHGIIHRDLKPSNIFLARMDDGSIQPRVLDFGIAKLVSDDDPRQLTVTMSVIGTPHYMSPEQAQSLPSLTNVSDQFTLGVVLYECLTGHRPYTAEGFIQLIQQVAQANFPPPRQYNPELPIELEAILLRAMHAEPDRRFATCAHFARALSDFVEAAEGLPVTQTNPAIVLDDEPT